MKRRQVLKLEGTRANSGEASRCRLPQHPTAGVTNLMKTLFLFALSTLVLAVVTAPIVAQPIGKPPEQLGTVLFANSCAPAVQTEFTRAVALLHSFWWQQGETAFRQILARDPSCAIATW